MSSSSRLRLSFATPGSDPSAIELVESEFKHPLIELKHRCVRGKTSGAAAGAGTFQWTAAVQAMTLLFLRREISGEQGTPAASLAFSLNKASLWLLDMFGVDPQGRAIARRMICASNPELKRPGPVMLALNTKFLGDFSTEVVLDGRTVSRADELALLAQSIENRWKPQRGPARRERAPRQSGAPNPFLDLAPNQFLESFRREVRTMLCETDIFNRERYVSRLRFLHENEFFRRFGGSTRQSFAEFDLSLPPAIRHGEYYDDAFMRSTLGGSRPVQVWLAATQLPSIVLFQYLKQWRGLNLEINTRFVHTLEISRALSAQEYSAAPDFCVLGYNTSSVIAADPERYGVRPIMLMPRASQRLLAPAPAFKKGAKSRTQDFRFFSEGPSVASYYFDRMVAEKKIERGTYTSRHCDPDDIAALDLEDPNLRVIAWFPYCDFAQIRFGLRPMDAESDPSREVETVLHVGDEFARNESQLRCFVGAVRNAWLLLQNDETLRSEVLQSVLSQPGYLRFLARSGGMRPEELEKPFLLDRACQAA